MEYRGEEGRKAGMYDNELRIDVALIKQKIEFIEEKVMDFNSNIIAFSKIFSEGEMVKKKDLDAHTVQDRWMFGSILAVLLGIFAKLLLK